MNIEDICRLVLSGELDNTPGGDINFLPMDAVKFIEKICAENPYDEDEE